MRALGVVLIVLGVLLGGAAGAGAAYVGSDDWVDAQPTVVTSDVEPIAVTRYGLMSFDAPVRITVSSSSGGVFVGTASPVDITDYTANASYADIASTSLRGLTVSHHSGKQDLPAAPAGLDFWLAAASGDGAQSLTITPGGDPVQVVAAALDGTGSITMTIGYQVSGAYRTATIALGIGIGLFLVGILLLVIGILGRRAARRHQGAPPGPQGPGPQGPGPQGAGGPSGTGPYAPSLPPTHPATGTIGWSPTSGGPDPSGAPPASPGGYGPAGRYGPQAHPQGPPPQGLPLQSPSQPQGPPHPPGAPPVARLAAVLLAGALVVTSAGCAPPRLPQGVAYPDRDTVTKVALRTEQAQALADDFNKRVDAANKLAGAPKYDASGWAKAYGGMVERQMRYTTTYRKVTKGKTPASCVLKIENVYARSFTSYPMTAAVSGTNTCGASTTASDERVLAVFRREHSYSPWLMVTTSFVPKDVLGTPPTGTDATPTQAQDKAALDAGKALIDYVGSDGSADVSVLADLASSLHTKHADGDYIARSITASFAGAAAVGGPGDPVQVVRVGERTLAFVSLRCDYVAQATDGGYVYWDSPYDKVFNQPGHRQRLSKTMRLDVVFDLSGSSPKMIGYVFADTL